LEADLPEQALRYFDNLAMSILSVGFFFSLHVSTIPPASAGLWPSRGPGTSLNA
jgi:hypothetical protein